MHDGQKPVNPLDVLWRAPVIAWVLIAGEGLAAILSLAPSVQQDRWVHLGLASLAIQWVSLLTLGGLYLLRNRLASLRPLAVAYVALGLLLVSTWLLTALVWTFLGAAWGLTEENRAPFLLRTTGLALTAGLMALAAFYNHWRARQSALRSKQSELESLQARIRPHFLFNTLNTGAALVHQRPEEAEHLLLDLADLFRAALGGPREIPLSDELALARRYLEIEGLRFGPRLHVEWQLPETIPDVMVPILTIQPLVENAIRHGVERLQAPTTVEIGLAVAEGFARITIRNEIPSSTSSKGGHQVGLASARARIEALTQGRGVVDASASDDHYTVVLTLPLADTPGAGPA